MQPLGIEGSKRRGAQWSLRLISSKIATWFTLLPTLLPVQMDHCKRRAATSNCTVILIHTFAKITFSHCKTLTATSTVPTLSLPTQKHIRQKIASYYEYKCVHSVACIWILNRYFKFCAGLGGFFGHASAPSCFELSTNHEWWVSAPHISTIYLLNIVSFPCINKNGKRLSNYYCQIDSEKVKS